MLSGEACVEIPAGKDQKHQLSLTWHGTLHAEYGTPTLSKDAAMCHWVLIALQNRKRKGRAYAR